MTSIGIIGGGASGMAAAITAKREKPDVQVTILEQKNLLGKKILVTGNGRCNLTNECMSLNCFRSENPELLSSPLNKYSVSDVSSFFQSLGVLTKSRQGYLYPRTDQASTVREALEREIFRLGVQVEPNAFVKKIEKINEKFAVIITDGNGDFVKKVFFDKVILSCGGKASPAQGSDGSGYKLSGSLGHHVQRVVPALVALKTKENILSPANGVRTNGKISVFADGTEMGTDTGELQITAYGISGIPAFQVSRYAAKGLYLRKNVTILLDFVPEMTQKQLLEFFVNRRKEKRKENPEQILFGLFPEKLNHAIFSYAFGNKKQTSSEQIDLKQLVLACKQMKLHITDTNGFKNAQVTAGGVPLTEMNMDTMESKIMDNLYITGELLDVDGICGGYNLHWAWISGMLAGKSAVKTHTGEDL